MVDASRTTKAVKEEIAELDSPESVELFEVLLLVVVALLLPLDWVPPEVVLLVDVPLLVGVGVPVLVTLSKLPNALIQLEKKEEEGAECFLNDNYSTYDYLSHKRTHL